MDIMARAKTGLSLLALLMIATIVCGTRVVSADSITAVDEKKWVLVTLQLTPSADASAQPFNASIAGSCLYQVEIKATDDDAVTFTINSALGTPLYTTTTSAATTGEIGHPAAFWAIPKDSVPTWTLSDFSGTGDLTIEVTAFKK